MVYGPGEWLNRAPRYKGRPLTDGEGERDWREVDAIDGVASLRIEPILCGMLPAGCCGVWMNRIAGIPLLCAALLWNLIQLGASDLLVDVAVASDSASLL